MCSPIVLGKGFANCFLRELIVNDVLSKGIMWLVMVNASIIMILKSPAM